MEGVLEHKKSLETDIEAQKAEQIKINDELLSLEESAKNFDSNALETQKAGIFSELYDLPKIVSFINTYINYDWDEHQHEEL